MNRPLGILFVALLFGCGALPAARSQQVAVEEFTLTNGMHFLLVPRRDQPNVISAGWLAKVGSANERPGITGLSHFFEHLMFKGTDTIGTRDPARDARFRAEQQALREEINRIVWSRQYARFRRGEITDPWNPTNDTPDLRVLRGQLNALIQTQQGRGAGGAAAGTIVKDEFAQLYTQAGGSGLNAFTSADLTCYFCTVPANKLELWAWLESDRLRNSVFREFYSERDVVHEERRLRTESTPTGRLQEQFDTLFWGASSYAWPVIGWPSDLQSYSLAQAQEYWDTYYRPGNLTGIVVGDFDPDQAKRLLTAYFARLAPGTQRPPPVVTLAVGQRAEQRLNAVGDFPSAIEIRYHTVPAGHADSYALDVLSELLNERTGRLYRGLVEGRKLATHARATSEARKLAGYFAFEAETQGEATPEMLETAWYEELATLQQQPLPERELRKVKNRIAAGNFRRLESNMSLLVQLAFAEALLTWQELNDSPKKYEAVTADDIQRVARRYFAPAQRNVASFRRETKPRTTAP